MSEIQDFHSSQTLEIAKEWTLDCDLFCDEELAKKVFIDAEVARQQYVAMFLQIQHDVGSTNSQQTKIYVERIELRIHNNAIIYEVQYPDGNKKAYSIGQINPDFDITATETIAILRQISDVKEGGGKWNAFNDLQSFWEGFIVLRRDKMKKLGILTEDESPPLRLTNADIPPRVSIFSKSGEKKTIVTEKTPRQKEDSKIIRTKTSGHAMDILVNGKTILGNESSHSRIHNLLGVLYKKEGSNQQENQQRARGYLETILLGSSTLTLNSELPELGGILQAIIDSKLLRSASSKAVSHTLTRLQLHLLECEIFAQSQKNTEAFLGNTSEVAARYGTLLGTIPSLELTTPEGELLARRKVMIKKQSTAAQEYMRTTEVVRNDLVCSCIEHIVLVMSTMNEMHHRTTYCDILVTSGQYGMAGLCSMFDYRVISSSKVLENSPDEEKLLRSVVNTIGPQKIIAKNYKDTTGCGDISMAAWLSSKLEMGQTLRELEYYEIFKKIGIFHTISAEKYRTAIAITEAYWRMCFTRVMSGLMFRTKAPNISLIGREAITTALEFVTTEVGHFMFRELASFVNGSKKVSNNGFFHLHAIAKMNRTGGEGSLEILCKREGISQESIVIRQAELLMAGINNVEDAYRIAKAELLHEKWGWKNHHAR